MTESDDALQAAIIDELNGELGATGITMRELSVRVGRPYDSTRNYLRKERPMPLWAFIEFTTALGVTPETLIGRARERLQR
ncbi:hypothetical protein [Microbacterium sp. 5K110]|uniref:hypothetical protein n=1 Tax=unclassified Microbacterium TaxID=2609290 RepID=UPI0010FEE7B0|nr:hypothetical protein [Microbacterium sp. 5K110]TLF33931.1 hypothetical protein FE256_02100 [Microbacterium sp. 5K110]